MRGLRAEYLVDFPRDEEVSGHAIYLYLATDKVRFVDRDTGLPMALESIRPVLFSELMRDVDLFVGYRRELMAHGIFELPLNLKRSHFSYAHTDDDVDRLLEATEAAVTTVLSTR